MSQDLPARKRLRLKGYNYSQNGAYFITICTKGRYELLGTIFENSVNHRVTIVGDAVLCVPSSPSPIPFPVQIPALHMELSEIGEKVNNYLKQMDSSHDSARLVHYVIMPNHVHLLIMIDNVERGSGTQRTASPTSTSPTSAVIPGIVHGLKSYTKKFVGESIWQRSYHDHIVRNEVEYQKIWKYIETNVLNWKSDVFYKSE